MSSKAKQEAIQKATDVAYKNAKAEARVLEKELTIRVAAEKAADAAVIAARLTVEQQEHDRLVAFANFYIASRGLHSAQVDLTTAERKSEHAELSRSQLDDEYQTGLTDVQTAFIAREKAYGRTRPPDKDRKIPF
jgi:hypothetical protein